jgi:NhaA family Na+:H+ antiporter
MSSTEQHEEKPAASLEKKFDQVISPFQSFIHDQTTGSIILIVCVVIALVVANSPLHTSYQHVLHLPLGLYFGDYNVGMSLAHWVNEGLMTVFFFLLGLEIKREVLVGEINQLKLLMPVVGGAVGGMLVPALIFYAYNSDNPFTSGWGIPMATDTAFAVGILALLGNRIPSAAFIFLTALAIIDDLGAVIVIGVFYSNSIQTEYLLLSGALLLALWGCNQLGIRRSGIYLFGGVLVWLAMLQSGLHATIAGVLVALTVPAHPEKNRSWFSLQTKRLLRSFQKFERQRDEQPSILAEGVQHDVVEDIKNAAEKSTTPLRRWEKGLEYPVALIILPIFALVNAGINIEFSSLASLWTEPLVQGVTLGLVIGKGLGIPLFVWVVLRCGWGELPEGIHLGHILGIGLLGGMGFSMSIFIANLAYADNTAALLTAKLGIIIASFAAGLLGYCWLRFGIKADKC